MMGMNRETQMNHAADMTLNVQSVSITSCYCTAAVKLTSAIYCWEDKKSLELKKQSMWLDSTQLALVRIYIYIVC